MEEEEEWVLARRGIQLVLNNQYNEAQKLFADRKDSIQLAAGRCLIEFMNALMSFEEDLLAESQATLRELEKRCAEDIGWLKSMRNKVFGSAKKKSEALRLEEQIILADTQVCMAIITFIQQDMKGCMLGGWALRKAWRAYEHTYSQLLTLYYQTFGSDNVPGSEFPSWQVIVRSPSTNIVESPSCEWSTPSSQQTTPALPIPNLGFFNNYPFVNILNALTPTRRIELKPEEVSRLMSAVSFGYGVFQLCVSLFPPSLLKFIQLLGFGADRVAGLDALMFSRTGSDMRAPLATICLLWYHTIVRPYFALDGANVQAGADTAAQLIQDSQLEFSNSALFLFFSGRIQRLKNNVPAAIDIYLMAVEKSPQRELQILSLHEVSWCYLIQLDWPRAQESFMDLKNRSRWCKIFYTYLAAVCLGANEQLAEAARLSREIYSYAYRINDMSSNSEVPHAHRVAGSHREPHSLPAQSQLEIFVCRRVNMLIPSPPSSHYCRLLAFEMLYLWNALPSTQYSFDTTIDCRNRVDMEPMVGLSSLLLGAIQRCRGQRADAEASLRAVLSQRQHLPDTAEDSHITAFALYELAQVLMQETASKYKEEAKSLLERAQRDCRGYDFESRLKVRIHAALNTNI